MWGIVSMITVLRREKGELMVGFKKWVVNSWLLLSMLFVPWAAAAGNGAKVVMQLVPDQVATGKEFTAVIQIKNTGDSTWSAANDYTLSTLTTQPWDSYRVVLDGSVAPGQVLTVKPKLMAPMVPGEYPLQWQMRQGQTLFGDKTAAVKVHVTGSLIPFSHSEFVFQSVPAVMVAGQSYGVTLQFKNIGETVWTSGQYQLVSATGNDLAWTVDLVEMGRHASTSPEGFQTFNFDIQAPAEPGIYPFQWQMQHKQMGRFGAMSRLLNIEVR